MHLSKTSKKRVVGCPEAKIHQGSNHGSHGPSTVTVCRESNIKMSKNFVKMMQVKNSSELGTSMLVNKRSHTLKPCWLPQSIKPFK